VGAWAKSWRESGESGREDPAGAAPAAVGIRTRKEATARESGCGSPGRESSGGELQGRERYGTRPRSVGGHGERRGPKDLERAASLPEPSRGARTLRTAPTRVWRSSSRTGDRKEARGGKGAPDVVVSEGARTSREADPRSWNGPVPFRRGWSGEGTGGRRRGSQHSGEDSTPRGKIAGLTFRGKVQRGTPRGRSSDVGGAPEANKALLVGHYKTLKGTGTSRESNLARATVRGSGQRGLQSLWRGHERTATRLRPKGRGTIRRMANASKVA
jgi:hypothetical protein